MERPGEAGRVVGRGAARLTLTLEDGPKNGGRSAAGDVSSERVGCPAAVRLSPPAGRGWGQGRRSHCDLGAAAVLGARVIGYFEDRPWGIFAPLYALRSNRNWGAGDLADLGELGKWVAEREALW